ncbi:hypothetical protein KBA73_03755 [Patescibacteria group bacterium]|nr:hypothetical protein [Patescibacteria group bacterium]
MHLSIRSLFIGLMLVVGSISSLQPVSAATTFYRGFALSSTQKFDAGGYAPLNALVLSGKKRAIKKEFADLLNDLGGMHQTFAPRDASLRNIVYLSTNHFKGTGSTQTGVFLVWKYNFDTGAYNRVFSLSYNPIETPMGYSVIGNEGSKLVVLKNIDGPYCERDIADLSSTFLKALDLRNLNKGLQGYTPSPSMKRVFHALPTCGWVDRVLPPLTTTTTRSTLSTEVHVLEHSRASTSMSIEARLSGTPSSEIPSLEGTQIMIFETAMGTVPGLSTGMSTELLKTCVNASSCIVQRNSNTIYADVSYYSTLTHTNGQPILSSPLRAIRDAN